MTLFKKIEYFFFSAKWGRGRFLFFVFLPVIVALILDSWGKENIILSWIFDDWGKENIPWVVIALGLFPIYFAANLFWKTQGSQFVVNYKVKSGHDSIPADDSRTKMPYVSKIYIRNKKNKFEAIQKVLLQIDKKTVILLANYRDNPLLIEPFKSETRELSPVTHYHTAAVFDSSLGTVKRKNFILDGESPSGCLLSFWKNKIIIQTENGVFPVEANIRANNSDLDKFKPLFPSIDHGKYETVLSGKIRAVCYMEIENKPEDIHDEDAWNAFWIKQEIFEKDEEGKGLSAKNLKDKFIKNKLDQFGLQVVMMKDSGELSAQYYALTKDNKKYMIHSPVSWWEDFYNPYKNCLEKEKTEISSERKKLPRPSFHVFEDSLKELIGEEKTTRLINNMSLSYRDTYPEGYYLGWMPFRSFDIFCLLLDAFLHEKKPTMNIIDSNIRYTYENDTKEFTSVGVHDSEDVVDDVEDLLDEANAFPYK